METGSGGLQTVDEAVSACRRPDWKPDQRYFRCVGFRLDGAPCRAVVPESVWPLADPTSRLCKQCRDLLR